MRWISEGIRGQERRSGEFYRDALQKIHRWSRQSTIWRVAGGIKGRQTEAIAAFKESIAANPDFLASRISLGDLDAQTETPKARSNSILRSLNPNLAYRGAHQAGELYLKSNQADLAIAQLRAAADLEKENPESGNSSAMRKRRRTILLKRRKPLRRR